MLQADFLYQELNWEVEISLKILLGSVLGFKTCEKAKEAEICRSGILIVAANRLVDSTSKFEQGDPIELPQVRKSDWIFILP